MAAVIKWAGFQNIAITHRTQTTPQMIAQTKFVFSISYSFESPKRKSAVHPVISQMIVTHSGAIRAVCPLHNAVILTCCATGVELGHRRAAMSFFITLLPRSLARAIACSIRIIINRLFLLSRHNRRICKYIVQ